MAQRIMMAFVVTMTLLIGGAGVAAAAPPDFCLDISSGFGTGVQLVGKGFSIPNKGTCTEFFGFYLYPSTTIHIALADLFVHGMACGSSDNTDVNIVLSGPPSATLGVNLTRATLSGHIQYCNPQISGGCQAEALTQKIACSPSSVPVPN